MMSKFSNIFLVNTKSIFERWQKHYSHLQSDQFKTVLLRLMTINLFFFGNNKKEESFSFRPRLTASNRVITAVS